MAARRELPIALAHRAVKTKPGTSDSALVARLYMPLSPADKLAFFGEVDACRAARRGEIEAEVAL